MKEVPEGYRVFEVVHRGCWHWKKDGLDGSSRCYDTEDQAIDGAREHSARKTQTEKAKST